MHMRGHYQHNLNSIVIKLSNFDVRICGATSHADSGEISRPVAEDVFFGRLAKIRRRNVKKVRKRSTRPSLEKQSNAVKPSVNLLLCSSLSSFVLKKCCESCVTIIKALLRSVPRRFSKLGLFSPSGPPLAFFFTTSSSMPL